MEIINDINIIESIKCWECNKILSVRGCKVCNKCQFKVCSSCYLIQNKCRYCISSVMITISSNSEKKNSNMEMDCINKSHGCLEKISFIKNENHSLVCNYRKVVCSCEKLMIYKEYLDHCKECPKVELICNQCQFSSKRENFTHFCEENIIYQTFNILENDIKLEIINTLKANQFLGHKRMPTNSMLPTNPILSTNPRNDAIFFSTYKNYSFKCWDLNGNKIFSKNMISRVNSCLIGEIQIGEKCVITGDSRGFIKLWSIGGKKIRKFQAHSGRIFHLSQYKNLDNISNLVSHGEDFTIKIWTIFGICIGTIKSSPNKLNCMIAYINNVNEMRIAGSHEKKIMIWSLQGELINEIKYHKKPITSLLAINNNMEKIIVSGSEDSNIILFNTYGERKMTLSLSKSVTCLAELKIFLKESQIVSGSEDCTVKIWDLSGKCIKTINTKYQITHLIYVTNKDRENIIIYADIKNRIVLFSDEEDIIIKSNSKILSITGINS